MWDDRLEQRRPDDDAVPFADFLEDGRVGRFGAAEIVVLLAKHLGQLSGSDDADDRRRLVGEVGEGTRPPQPSSSEACTCSGGPGVAGGSLAMPTMASPSVSGARTSRFHGLGPDSERAMRGDFKVVMAADVRNSAASRASAELCNRGSGVPWRDLLRRWLQMLWRRRERRLPAGAGFVRPSCSSRRPRALI